jgi:hypothetical protein
MPTAVKGCKHRLPRSQVYRRQEGGAKPRLGVSSHSPPLQQDALVAKGSAEV